MPSLQRFTNRRRAGLASYTFQAGLGPARAFSSYARRIFYAKYQDKHRHPRVVFVFDAALLGICALLVAVLVSVALRPPRPSLLTLNLTAPALTSGAPVPLIARIGATKDVHNVRLQWRLPPGTEILSSEPVVSADGRVFLGDISPGELQVAHLVVRLYQPVGATASFGFSFAYEENGQPFDEVGSEERQVTASALAAVVPDEFRVDSVSSQGGMIPLVIENTTALKLPYVQVTFDPPVTELGERVTLGSLAAKEKRYVFVPIHRTEPVISGERDIRLKWIVSSGAREVSRGAFEADIFDWKWPTVTSALISRPTSETHIRLSGVESQMTLLVAHPLLDPEVREIELTSGQTDVVLPSFTIRESPAHEWFVALLGEWPEGGRLMGPATMGVIRSAIPFETSVRYTSSEGDQIGAGPNPPKVGEDTRYWVFWTIGPVADEVRDVRVSATLPTRVRATGNVTAPNGGMWDVSGQTVRWSLPRLGGIDASEAVFGFEVEVSPRSQDAGRPIMVVATSTATAADDSTDTTFRMQAGPETSEGPVLP
ncbi:hypothetical protein A3E39_01440 [Candidatus Uhrbacteria bacterium RIFCSPHIGHO2_12_FULL_60_25]|uniref:MHD domain-containing protein n=1 Tax=Candidatus Uhrbacteria bacterium RIFCSPHIGHO2_12_FULL_60_25 TaxID=1802399 RepID=A0A1F7UM81_9BACT|nr:MAG: hypothetical protein A3D73_03460 [Candidatus Uhrbacteria bacterium RIFCSPHIGHO2_02_FULL_60_44]OGL78807.1 MAG: hypothetical protein A3E39_01440 [Candidatus Uhrbacteria bacterium RIFCSPHIGHO2_12_FULL_60_25]